MNNKKIFSIVVPVYNAEKTIERTLSSFISSKDYIHEVILVNDKSTDTTFDKVEIFQKFFQIIIVDNIGNHNPSAARRTGLIRATGDWITFVDSDDCLTFSSLRYVYKRIIENDNLLLLHCQSIYYESGNFNINSIGHSDTSCGGNFYNRKYLIRNRLYPHETLYLTEDEYFNEKVIKYITYCDIFSNDFSIEHYDYPVYEVHHDIEDGFSFAMRNWCDYLCRYRLLYKEYLTEDFIQYPHMKNILLKEFCDNIIFCFFLCQGLILDDDFEFNIEDNIQYFKRAITYFINSFNEEIDYLISYYNDNIENTNNILLSAKSSTGIEFESFIQFDTFVTELI